MSRPEAPPQSTGRNLRTIWRHMTPARRFDIFKLFGLVIASGFAELLSIGAVIPFLALLAGLQSSSLPDWLAAWIAPFGLDATQLMIAATVVLAVAAVVAGGVRLLLAWKSQKVVFEAAYELSVNVYSMTLHQPYPEHVARNTALMLADINKAIVLAGSLFLPLIQAAGAAIMALFLIFALLWVDARVAIAAGVGFAVIYGTVIWLARGNLSRHGLTVARAWDTRIKVASEGLGGIRDIILDRTHDVFIGRFRQVEGDMHKAQMQSNFLAAAPRFVIEALGIVLFGGIALALTLSGGSLAVALPTLGAMALGAQRLLPLLQSVYVGWAAHTAFDDMLGDLARTLETDVKRPAPAAIAAAPAISFQRAIRFDDVSFAYPGAARSAIVGARFVIRAGERVGIVGPSGSGKSTLMDLLLGLQVPTAGNMLIDDLVIDQERLDGWQQLVAHVPQSVYLADATIAENIAFGVPPELVDADRLLAAAASSQVLAFANELPDGLDTMVGERGARISGGQKQRIGIARALYKQAQMLVFDEATSALDSVTETEVNAAIQALDRRLTLVIVAHRATSVALCDRWLVIEKGEVRELDQAPASREGDG